MPRVYLTRLIKKVDFVGVNLMGIDLVVPNRIKILTICIFVLVMFSTVNGTAGSTLSPKTYSPNILLQLPVKRLLQHVSTHQVSMVAMTTLYCLQPQNDLLLLSSSQTYTHNQEYYWTIYSSLLCLIISHFLYLCLPEDWIKKTHFIKLFTHP